MIWHTKWKTQGCVADPKMSYSPYNLYAVVFSLEHKIRLLKDFYAALWVQQQINDSQAQKGQNIDRKPA